MKNYKSIIFDLDGTLMDTSLGIYKSIDNTLKEFDLNFREEEDKTSFIGPPIGISFQKYFNLDDIKKNEMTDYFRNDYKDNNLCKAVIYENILELLNLLKTKKIKTGVATYKRYDYANKLLEEFDLTRYFDEIQGSDFENKLTKKDILEITINNLKNNMDEVLFIGDTLSDLEASKSLGVDFMAVTYGFGFKDSLDYVHDNSIYIADDVNSIIKYLMEENL